MESINVKILIVLLLRIFFCRWFQVIVYWLHVLVVKYEVYANTESAHVASSSRVDEGSGLSNDGEKHAARENTVCAARR